MLLRKKFFNNQDGSVLVYVLMAALALGGSAYFLMSVVGKNQKESEVQRTQFSLDLIAEDIKEYGKYLMFYEKMFYVNKALNFDKNLRENWQNSFGVGNDACGYKGLDLTYQGTNKIAGEFVFCPVYLRNNLLASDLLDESLFVPWKDKDLLKFNDGVYSLTLNLKDLKTDNNFTKFYVNENGLLTDFDGIQDAKIVIEFFSTASGVSLKNADRMFRISSEVYYQKNFASRKIKSNASETFLLKPSTPRGFSIFLLYPLNRTDQKETDVFYKAFHLNENDQIFGKTYANTDFEFTDMTKVPTFFDTLIIGKEFQETVPNDVNLSRLKEKFRNGLITNFSADRFLLDSPGLINNASSLAKKLNELGMDDYISKMGTIKACQEEIFSGMPDVTYKNTPTDCSPFKVNEQYISGGVRSLTINGAYSFVQGPVKSLSLNNGLGSNIYGVIAGGIIDKSTSGSANKFYSLQTLRVGLPGIVEASPGANEIVKSELDTKSALATDGVTVPLLNIPNIYSSEMGFR